MPKRIVAAVMALALTGCWVSEKDLFGPGDWQPPPDIAGSYTSENGAGEAQARVVLSVRSDGLVQGVATKVGESTSETSVVGFVPIPGGTGKYYLLVDRSKAGEPDDSGGNIYFVARMTDEGFDAFWPQCEGTPDIPGMERETQELIDEEICGFTTKEALLRAGLAAERNLEGKHLFEPDVMGRMKRETPDDDSEAEAAETEDPAETDGG